MQLMEAAAVEVGDGHWTSSYQYDTPGCALSSSRTDICTPVRQALTGDSAGSANASDGFIFAVVTSMKGRARCSLGSEGEWVKDALDMETEKAAGTTLWDGIGGAADAYLMAPEVSTVASGATVIDTVAALLEKFWQVATGVREEDTVLHVGIKHLMVLANQGILDADSTLKGTKVKVASSPGYALTAAAVTGPVRIRLSTDQVVQVPDISVNDLINEATRLVAIEFDPCTAVRAT